ncbi:hypothetical protein AMJ85_05715, partial [candidate division BRC1 bacterium SM23_51]
MKAATIKNAIVVAIVLSLAPGASLSSAEAAADFGDAPSPFPSLLAENGPHHADVTQEWIGGPESVTTVEDDALPVDEDDEVAWCWAAQ